MRRDPLKMSGAIITKERGRSPRDYSVEGEQVSVTACPFRYGKEDGTAKEVFAIRPPGSPPYSRYWRVRVIPSDYPALKPDGELKKKGHGLYDSMNGVGAHELIVETPDHDRSLADLSAAEIADVMKACRARLFDLRRASRLRYIIIFKNHGVEAGAGIPASQLIAIPMAPPVTTAELGVCPESYDRKERRLLCDILEQEREEDGDFLVIAPYASHPFRAAHRSAAPPSRFRAPERRGPRKAGLPGLASLRLPLADRTGPPAAEDRRIVEGDRLLHQPDATGNGRRIPPR